MKKELGKFFVLCAFFAGFMLLGSAIESLMPLPAVLLGLGVSAVFGWAACRFMVLAPASRCKARRVCAPSLRTAPSSRHRQARQAA